MFLTCLQTNCYVTSCLWHSWVFYVIFIVFLALSNFEVSFYVCFWRFEINKYPFTRRFEGHVHQTLCLCTAEPRRREWTFPAMDRVLFISVLEPYMLKTYLGNSYLISLHLWYEMHAVRASWLEDQARGGFQKHWAIRRTRDCLLSSPWQKKI